MPDALVVSRRKPQDREATPSLLAIDSQSVKTVQFVSEETGIDGGKKINGRKRTILADKPGLLLAIKVTGANISDNQSGIPAIDLLKGKVCRLQKIAADNGYKITFLQYVQDRWQVERSFGWLNFRRRLFREVEKTIFLAEAMLQIAFISFIINKI